MSYAFSLLLGGLSLGAVYALVSIGFVIIYRSTGVVNFAHGSVLLVGGYLIARWTPVLGFGLAVVAGLLASALLAAVLEAALLRPLRVRGAGHDAAAILTIGLNTVLLTDLTRRIGSEVLHVGDPWGDAVVRIGDAVLPLARAAAMVSAVVLIGAFLLAFRFSSWGISMRATAEDPEAAVLMGIRPGVVAGSAWATAAAMAAVACVFLAASPSPGLDASIASVALTALPVVVIGGLDSVGGAMLAGMIVGVLTSFGAGYQDRVPFLGAGFETLLPWLLMVITLVIRPTGLFGSRSVARV